MAHFNEVGSGYAGYSEDHEYSGYRQTLQRRASQTRYPGTRSFRVALSGAVAPDGDKAEDA